MEEIKLREITEFCENLGFSITPCFFCSEDSLIIIDGGRNIIGFITDNWEWVLPHYVWPSLDAHYINNRYEFEQELIETKIREIKV